MGLSCTVTASMLCVTHYACFVYEPLGKVSPSVRGGCFPRCGERVYPLYPKQKWPYEN